MEIFVDVPVESIALTEETLQAKASHCRSPPPRIILTSSPSPKRRAISFFILWKVLIGSKTEGSLELFTQIKSQIGDHHLPISISNIIVLDAIVKSVAISPVNL
jgi:hypothetical protein